MYVVVLRREICGDDKKRREKESQAPTGGSQAVLRTALGPSFAKREEGCDSQNCLARSESGQ